jgi:hypothetical protein
LPVEGIHGGRSTYVGQDCEQQHDESGDLGTTGRARRTTSDEHQENSAKPGALLHRADVHAIEAHGTRHHGLEASGENRPSGSSSPRLSGLFHSFAVSHIVRR